MFDQFNDADAMIRANGEAERRERERLAGEVEEYRRRHPACEVNDELYEGSWGTWRFADEASTELVPRYALLREQFGYDTLDYSVYWLDPNY